MSKTIALLLISFAAACGGSGDQTITAPPPPPAPAPPPPPPPPPASAAPIASLTLSHASATMAKMQDLQLTVTARDSAGQVLTGRTMSWESSSPANAIVDGTGRVGARAAGSATITVRAEGRSAESVVRVIVLSSVVAGLEETCAISDTGKLYCAGARYGPLARLVAPELRFNIVQSGSRVIPYWCGITVANALYCWGENLNGELGTGDQVDRTEPTAVASALRFKGMALGRDHTCALTTDGDAYCWGSGGSGQLGTGSFSNSLLPVQVAGGLKFTQLTADRFYTCGLTVGQRVYCWGDNEQGHLGRGPGGDSEVPVQIQSDVEFRYVTGGAAACALDLEGRAYCWGDNTVKQLGLTTTELCFGNKPCSTSPRPVETALRFSMIESSTFSTCALQNLPSPVFCWGMNIDGKFGVILTEPCPVPGAMASCPTNPVTGPGNFVTLSSSATSTCGIHVNGGAYCWGDNRKGQLATPGAVTTHEPAPFSLDPLTLP